MPSYRHADGREWAIIAFICTVFLIIIGLSQMLFFVALGIIAVGIVWIVRNRDGEFVYIPLFLIIIGAVLAFVTWQIGYVFPSTELGKGAIGLAETVVDADKAIGQIPTTIIQGIIGAFGALS